jgi:hypothetical protein
MVSMFRQVTAGISAGQPVPADKEAEIAELRRRLAQFEAAESDPQAGSTAPQEAPEQEQPGAADESPASPVATGPAPKRKTAAPAG